MERANGGKRWGERSRWEIIRDKQAGAQKKGKDVDEEADRGLT